MSLDDGESVRYWTTLMDAEVSHKTLMALIYCLLERTKQVSKKIVRCSLFFTIASRCLISMGRYLNLEVLGERSLLRTLGFILGKVVGASVPPPPTPFPLVAP